MNANTKRMTGLAKTFPALAGVPGTDPFNVSKLITWAEGPGAIGASYHAAQFLLQVAGVGHEFDVVTAMVTWDDASRAAFMAWAAAPWAGGR